ncbi:uncharacterized protein CXQ87_002305 [Candidozyma duobushaemuli]|uniref:Survival factor 1 n=2 Tax=Candidozyma TaxID=3303203 RepID=A0ABX8I301_9ASCO|nr:uncharacterized protein CXQ87_002305 [[Candida] duobushaemulonis]PVH14179.1 hypothetical protein CXQ87_002305 [[Candida] duobushaemulonis]QWU87630.1 hypothetical protein CA3LBN_001895 [[Candida] haemuloni]
MLKWVQSGLSVVAGTAEPEYGREAIHPITDFIKKGDPVSRETTSEDFAWRKPGYTNVETQTFYFSDLKTGYTGFAQIIHSNLMGVKTTAQFTFRLYNNEKGADDPNAIWTSTALEEFRAEGSNFYAKNLSFELADDGVTYHLKSLVNEDSLVDLTVKRLTPGVVFGKDGTTLYGDDLENPWGSMRHAFWPRCSVTGKLSLKNNVQLEIDGFTMFVMALQGMKPHHAAKSWNFLNFQSPHFSAVQMEFTTPRSYATTKVNIAILAKDDKVVLTSIDNEVTHEDAEIDEVGWNVPKGITFNFSKDGPDSETVAVVSGKLNQLVERVDVMAEIPQFVKNIVSGVSGAKPYIYQFCNPLSIKYGSETEEGIGFNEATFISD